MAREPFARDWEEWEELMARDLFGRAFGY